MNSPFFKSFSFFSLLALEFVALTEHSHSQPSIAITPVPTSVSSMSSASKIAPVASGLSFAGSFTDTRDGREYRWIRIGEQKWMAENLVYGPPLPDAEDLGKIPSKNSKTVPKGKSKKTKKSAPIYNSPWCYENDPENCLIYGRLYDLKTAEESCPLGWKLPSDADWQKLEVYAGLDTVFKAEIAMRGAVGSKLKAKTQWPESAAGSDDFGFSAFPAGLRTMDGKYLDLMAGANYWAASESPSESEAYFRTIGASSAIGRFLTNKANGLSVRCVER